MLTVLVQYKTLKANKNLHQYFFIFQSPIKKTINGGLLGTDGNRKHGIFFNVPTNICLLLN